MATKAIAMPVPLRADSVGPPRLLYGSLPVGGPGVLRATDALFFELADETGLGRVTFEGLDAVRAARGENLPFDIEFSEMRRSWVFVAEGSPWLTERHEYEMTHYQTPLLDDFFHYVFSFHDEFIEAIAKGIWLERPDPGDPYAVAPNHPLAGLPESLNPELHESSGLKWELRRTNASRRDLLERSHLCSQPLFQFNLVLDGKRSPGVAAWLRTMGEKTCSRMYGPWNRELARVDGVADVETLLPSWTTYVSEVADRRRKMGKL